MSHKLRGRKRGLWLQTSLWPLNGWEWPLALTPRWMTSTGLIWYSLPFFQTSCKSAVAFFQFSILANYFWLLVEGMYLQTLLALTFVFQKKYFWWYILIGWGGRLIAFSNHRLWFPSFIFSPFPKFCVALFVPPTLGLPTTIITAWILTRNFYDDRGWDAAWYSSISLVLPREKKCMKTIQRI